MKSLTKAMTLLVASVALATPASAQSQLTPVDPACDYSVWIVSTIEIFNPNATACAGAFAGNDVQQQGAISNEIVNVQGWGTSAQYLGTTDADETSGPFSYVPDNILGYLNFDSPLTGDYVVALKAANQFSLYYFAGLVGQGSIFYTTLGTAQNPLGWPKDLSHASLWSVGGRTVSVPEPGSIALILTGMAGLAFVANRRRRENRI